MKFIEVDTYSGNRQNVEKVIINMDNISYVSCQPYKDGHGFEDVTSMTVILKNEGRLFHLTGEASDFLIKNMEG